MSASPGSSASSPTWTGTVTNPASAPPPGSEPTKGSLARPKAPVAFGVLWFVVTAVLFAVIGQSILHKVTWYLSAWQLGFLTFGRDIAHGAVFHRSVVLDALQHVLPARTDAVVQTYVWDHGELYCRYAPGFPILLAILMRWVGDGAVHYLNPAIFILLLALLAAVGWRVFRSLWLATAIPALVFLIPTLVSLWALTPMPDLAAHLTALFALYLVLDPDHALSPQRAGIAGVVLGYAVSIRPDAALYLLPVGLVASLRFRRSRDGARRSTALAAVALVGLLAGAAPFLAYNALTSGNPLRPTQVMEVEEFFSPVAPVSSTNASARRSPAWRTGSWTQVQGGGLRLANFRGVFPANVAQLRVAYGDFLLAAAAWGAVLALMFRPVLLLATVPYIVPALMFFSCWSKPDSRLLAGVHLLMPLLVVEGMFGSVDLVVHVARQRSAAVARLFALGVTAVFVVGVLLAAVSGRASALPSLVWLLVGTSALAMLGAADERRVRAADLAAAGLAIGLTVFAGVRSFPTWRTHATFQRAAMEHARATFTGAVHDAAVVITTEDVGRPAENIEYYADVPAIYLTDLERWRLSIEQAAALFIEHGLRPYLFIPTAESRRDEMLGRLSRTFTVEHAGAIPARSAIEYFVAAAFVPGGVAMDLYRIAPRQ